MSHDTDWTPPVDAEWHRLYAIHDDGDRDEMMRMAIVELLELRRITGAKPMYFEPRPKPPPSKFYDAVPTYSEILMPGRGKP